MKIDEDHLYHGAALTQIAEDPHFTAINALEVNGVGLRNAFRVNADIGVHIKYSSSPKGNAKEYQFTFTSEHVGQLNALKDKLGKVFLALVCVKDRHICCLSLAGLNEFVQRRREAMGSEEEQHVLLVTLEEGKRFRVYVSVPGQRGVTLGKSLVVARNAFPGSLFEGQA